MTGKKSGVNILEFKKLSLLDAVKFVEKPGERFPEIHYWLLGRRAGVQPLTPQTYEERRHTPATANLASPQDRVFVQDDPSARLAARAAGVWSDASASLAEAARDDSPSRRLAASTVTVLDAERTLGGIWVDLIAQGEALNNGRHQLFYPPVADAEQQQLDIEIRARLSRLSKEEWNKLVHRLADVGMERVLVALRRDELLDVVYSDEDAKTIVKAWEAMVRAGVPKATDAFDAANETWLWACRNVLWIAQSLANPNITGATAVDTLAIYRVLRDAKMDPEDAGELLGIEDDNVVRHLENKLVQEAEAKKAQPTVTVSTAAVARAS